MTLSILILNTLFESVSPLSLVGLYERMPKPKPFLSLIAIRLEELARDGYISYSFSPDHGAKFDLTHEGVQILDGLFPIPADDEEPAWTQADTSREMYSCIMGRR
jgi:hypothetical protein